MEKFVFSKEIGRGSFGKVFLIESRQTGIQYVLKQIDLSKLDKKQAKSASREVEVLSKLKHSHIVRYKESYETDNHLGIIMEYCENGDLHRRIKEKRTRNECFNDGDILDYFVQICLALEYIHEEKILHRDIKTKNIFLTKGNLVKLGDFGVAKVLENSFELASTCIGSPYYISPEICENKPYNKKSDIWALGCVLYELSTLKYAFVAKNVKILISKISSGTFNPLPVNVNAQIRSLLINLLKPNPKDRPTASEILNKPFLQKYKSKYSPETGSYRKRSNSGGSSKSIAKISSDSKTLSASCTKLNDLKRSKFANITLPETKYRVTFLSNKFRRKIQGAGCGEDAKELGREELRLGKNSTGGNKIKKFGRLLKVDSEYYNMIAESNQAKKETAPESVEESRRKWMANTLEKNQLLTALSEAELIDITAVRPPQLLVLDKEQSSLTVDDLLKLEPSEMSEDILKPMKIEQSLPLGVKEFEQNLKNLKDEIHDIKMKFEENNRYDIQDLLKLTENTRRILMGELTRRCSEKPTIPDVTLYEYIPVLADSISQSNLGKPKFSYGDENSGKNESDSVYFDLELNRMKLEKTVGFTVFLDVYRLMLDMLNDYNKLIERTWMTIIETFGLKLEYIPDIWECAVRESVYY